MPRDDRASGVGVRDMDSPKAALAIPARAALALGDALCSVGVSQGYAPSPSSSSAFAILALAASSWPSIQP